MFPLVLKLNLNNFNNNFFFEKKKNSFQLKMDIKLGNILIEEGKFHNIKKLNNFPIIFFFFEPQIKEQMNFH